MSELPESDLEPYRDAINEVVMDQFAELGVPQEFWPALKIQPPEETP